MHVLAVSSPATEKGWAAGTLKSMSLRDQIAQLVQIRVGGKFIHRQSPEYQKIAAQIRQSHVGGLVLFAGNVYESAILLNEFQALSKLPLLVAADFERGASFRIADTTSFPWTMALGATGSEQLAYQQGLATAQESRAMGVHWIFAPVMDVNNNPDNPVINVRSLGEDPELVARLGSAFIRGARQGGVLTTAKHFPGHGDTATDSHIGLPVVASEMARLQSLEFIPFQRAIDAGVDSIMTAHVAVPRITGDARLPATLSAAILTDTLRNRLNFRGLIVTDALEMAGVADRYWCGLAAVRAIQAGADVLLLPPDAAVAIDEVERAVRRGDISADRIHASAKKVLEAKARMHLPRSRRVPLRPIADLVASPQHVALAQEIADRAITAVKDTQKLLPVDPLADRQIFSLVLASDLESSPGSVFQNALRERFPEVRTAWGNARISEDLLASIDQSISKSDLIICTTLVRLASGQSGVSIPASHRRILDKIQAAQKPVIWVALGNPYVLRLAPQIGTYLCAFSYSDSSQIAAAKAISGEIPITGTMPVSIPGIAGIGQGLQIPRLEMSLSPASPEELGLPPQAFEESSQLLAGLVANQTFSGAQLIIGYQGRIAVDLNAGQTSWASDSAAVASNTIFNLTSLSLPLGATMAAMTAAEFGDLRLESPWKDYAPEVRGIPDGNMRVQDFFRALSGRPASVSARDAGLVLEKICTRSAGKAWPLLLEEKLLLPMGMRHTLHAPPTGVRGRIADGAESESFALYSNARDIASFAQMLLNRGRYAHRRYASARTLGQLTGSNGPWSLASDAPAAGGLLSSAAFGHSAANGSFLWIDPGRKLFLLLLANGRQEDARVREAQQRLAESLLRALSL